MSKKVNSFTNDALGTMDAVGISQAIEKKQISALEATEAAIQRAEKVNPDLNAIVVKSYDLGKQQATNNAHSFFKGVPSFIKDNDLVEGMSTQLGSNSFRAKKQRKNSKFVNQFLDTGLTILGKTTLPEFGLICSTENPKWGITRNPWNTDHTTGGSSSGAAALVASGVVPIATANDGAGSTRIPASCCGLVGLKPTRNRIYGMDGDALMPIKIVHQGVLTRSVRDTAAFYAAAEKHRKHPSLNPLGYVKNASKKRLKVAVFSRLSEGKLGRTDNDTENVYRNTAKLLESMGHQVEELQLPVTVEEVAENFLIYYGFLAYMITYRSFLVLGTKVDMSQLETFTLGLANTFRKNKLGLYGSIRNLNRMGALVESYFPEYDVVMTPTLGHSPPKIGHFGMELDYKTIADRAVAFAPFTGLQNVTGSPAISIPCGTSTSGLPIGMQFIAPFGKDQRLLEIAYELEEANPWKHLYE